MRIGESLVVEGKLTREQLSRALRVQQQLGGRLGTVLLELGLIDEPTLLTGLGRQRSTKTVSHAQLGEIPASVVRMIPAKLAARYGVVPFELKGRTLFVASRDIGDALKEDEIGFLTSCLVRTCIALEVRLFEALQRYYRVTCPERHQALANRLAVGGSPTSAASLSVGRSPTPTGAFQSPPTPLSGSSAPRGEARPPTPTLTPSDPAAPREARPADLRPVPPLRPVPEATPPTASEAPVPKADAPSSHPMAASPPKPKPPRRFIELDAEDAALLGLSPEGQAVDFKPPAPQDPALLEPTPLPWLGRHPEPEAASPSEVPRAASEAVAAGLAPGMVTPSALVAVGESADVEERLRAAAAELKDAEIRDDIADVLLAFAAPYFRRRVLLVARKESIVGWRGEGEGVDQERVRTIQVPAEEPSIFLGLRAADSFWLGGLPELGSNAALVEGLGGLFPKDCVVLPVTLRSRIVCYLYGDNLEAGVTGAPIAELRRLIAKAGLAFEVYILKNKIRIA